MKEFEIIQVKAEKSSYDTTLQILISRELKKEAQKVALDNEESLSEVIRKALQSYIEQNKSGRKRILKNIVRKEQ